MDSKNYIFAAASVGASTGNIVLLYSVYGAGHTTVAYFLCANTVAAVNLLLLTFLEQFPYFYTKKRLVNPEEAEQFFSSVLVLSFCIVIPACLLVYSIPETIAKIFSSKLERLELLETAAILKRMALTLLSTTPLYLFQQRFNCAQKIKLSYLVSLLPTLWLTVVLFMAKYRNLEIIEVINLFVAGGLATLFFTVFHGLDSYANPTFKEAGYILKMVKQSAKIRTAHNIHNFISIYLINNAASATPANLASIFFGVKRGVDAFVQVSVGPFLRSLPAVLTNQIGSSMHESITQKLGKNAKVISLVYGVTMFAMWITAIAISSWWSFNREEVFYFFVSLTALMAYGLAMSVEIPFSMVCSAYGKSLSFYLANTAFIITLGLSVWVLVEWKMYEVLPLGLFIGQTAILFINRSAAMTMLIGRDKG